MCLHPKLPDIGGTSDVSSLPKLDLENDLCEYTELDDVKTLTCTKYDLRMLHLNCRGVTNKQSEISKLLNNFGAHKPNIMLLNETWLIKDTERRVNIPGYEYCGKARVGKKGGGVGFLVKANTKYRKRDDILPNCTVTEHCTIELKTQTASILVSSLYRPPNTDVKTFLSEYNSILEKLLSTNNHVLIGMDHNLDLLKCHNHPNTQLFLEMNLERNMLPCITKPTRITHTSPTLIDNIFISKPLQKSFDSGIIIDDISDHLLFYTKLTGFMETNKEPISVIKRKLDDKAINKIKTDLDLLNWESLLHPVTASEGFDIFHERLLKSVDKHAPEKLHLIKLKCVIKEPWMTPGLLKCEKKQKSLYKRLILTNRDEQSKIRYNDYRSVLRQLKRYCKTTYYKDKCVEFKTSTKKLWQLVNKVINKQSNKTNVIESLKIDNIKHYSSHDITNEFAKYFSTVGKKYANSIKNATRGIKEYLKAITRCNRSLFMQPTHEIEIGKLIRNLPNKTSSGYDDISNLLLKKLEYSVVIPMTIIFNKSLNEGKFPEAMKMAEVVPLHKSKSKDITSNYRPISLLITVSKVLEKLVYSRTYNFLTDTGQIYVSQYGFRKDHSCTNAVSELLSGIVKGIDKNEKTVAVFLDLSKAFDTLKHDILLKKMELYGIRGTALDWFESYLKDRSIRVKCHTEENNRIEYSQTFPITYGTPQGSCLGPLLFLIFCNDVHMHLQHTSCILFADDTTLYFTHRNMNYLKWCIQEDLNMLADWFRANKLTLNMSKTVYMIFNDKKHSNITLVIGDEKLPYVTSTKFLGIWLDSDLSWNEHLSKLHTRLKQNQNLIRLGKNMLSTGAKETSTMHIFIAI